MAIACVILRRYIFRELTMDTALTYSLRQRKRFRSHASQFSRGGATLGLGRAPAPLKKKMKN